MTREQAMLLMTYLGRAGPIVPVTMVEAASLQPALQAVAGVACGTLACSFAAIEDGASPSSRAKPGRATK
jgi:hypothetical protein